MNKIKIIFFGIIIIASFLRLWQFGNVPPSPDWDEAALGYNAYSVLYTGKDEYGKFLPIVLRSFDDYKPALYAYLIIPFIKVFGLSVVSVRLPSALFGIITVIATFFLVKELFKNKKLEISGILIPVEYLALLSSFLLAISPWHIQFSRVAFESNVGVALNVLSLLFFLKGVRNPKFILLAFFFGAINIYMYQSEKVFTVLLFIILILIYRKELLKIKRKFIIGAILIAFVVGIPMIHYTLTDKNALSRAKGVSVFSDQTQFLKRNAVKFAEDNKSNDYLGIILDNRRLEYGKAIFNGYISHFDLNWLFISGDIARHHAPFMGLLYLFELPFLLIGVFILIFGKFETKTKILIFAYFLLAPLPASITSGVPHAVRTLNFLPTFQIFIALGLLFVWVYLTKVKPVLRIGVIYIFLLIFIFNFTYYFNQYFVQLNYYNALDWQYGYKEAVSYIEPIQKNYKEIIVANERPLDQSYMFFLFYLNYPPESYLKEGGTESGGFKESHDGFSNYIFRSIDWNREDKDKRLFIGRSGDFPDGAKVIKTIYLPNGDPVIKIVEG